MLQTGRIQIYTGDGKGKTTAAFGLALRAVGQGLKVIIIQFLKGNKETGELIGARGLAPGLTVKPMGREGFVRRGSLEEQDRLLARNALDEAAKIIDGRQFDVLVLDEINVAVSLGLVDASDVLALVGRKPHDMELVLTGRGAPQSLIDRADLVTTMQCTKHYFKKGQQARKGIEY